MISKIFKVIAMVLGIFLGSVLVAQAATSVFQIFQGGTGTSTAPTLGQVPVGNSAGTFTYTSSSSLGLISAIPVTILQGGTATTTQVTNGLNYFDGTRITSSPALTYSTVGCTSASAWGYGASSTDSGAFDFDNCATGLNTFHIGTSGNVGFGTVTPSNLLSVWPLNTGSSTAVAEFGQTSNNSSFVGVSGDRAMFGFDSFTGYVTIQGGTTKGFNLLVGGTTSVFGSGVDAFTIDQFGSASFSSVLAVNGLLTAPGGIASYATSTVGNGNQNGGITINGGATTTKPVILSGNGNQLVIGATVGSSSPYLYISGSQQGAVEMIIQNAANSGTSASWLDFQLNSAAGGQFTSGGRISVTRNNSPTAGSSDMEFWNTSGTTFAENMVIKAVGNVGFGTTTPYGKVSINAPTTFTSPLFVVSSSTTAGPTPTVFMIANDGHIIASSTTPTLSGCGTTPKVNGDDTHGYITVGAAATGCVLTYQVAYSARPSCTLTNESMSITSALTYTPSATALTISQATGLGGDIIDYDCKGVVGPN